VPGAPFGSALAATAVPAFGRQDGGQLCRPLSNGLVAEDDAALEDHLAELLQREAVAQAPEHDQGDDVGRILVRFSTPALRSLNYLSQLRQRKRR
jgi:hypothetical protein